MRNVRFLGAARRRSMVNPETTMLVLDAFEAGQTIGELVSSVSSGGIEQGLVRQVVLHLLWMQVLAAELDCPLTESAVLAPHCWEPARTPQ